MAQAGLLVAKQLKLNKPLPPICWHLVKLNLREMSCFHQTI